MLSNRELFSRFLAQTSPGPLGIEIVSADGIYLHASGGKVYMDMISGISVSSLGHGNKEVVKAMQEQLARHLHLMVYGEYIQAPQVQLAALLCACLPTTLDNVYFTNSGSEAVEGALKLAKRCTGRQEMIAFRGAYHGHTHAALSLMGEESMKRPFRPLLPGVKFLTFNNISDLEQISGKTACVIVEPVQGEAGVVLPEPGFLGALRARCSETGALLIFDEVQTGMGRTGSLFAFSSCQVVPDVLVLAKALGAGMPLGAFIAPSVVMKELSHDPPLGHITTFGGHPLSCAAGYAGLQVLLREKYWESVEYKSNLFRQLLGAHPAVKEIRAAGLLMAVELGCQEKVKQVIAGCLSDGLISDWFLFCPTAIRLAPPLIITDEQIREACSVLVKQLD